MSTALQTSLADFCFARVCLFRFSIFYLHADSKHGGCRSNADHLDGELALADVHGSVAGSATASARRCRRNFRQRDDDLSVIGDRGGVDAAQLARLARSVGPRIAQTIPVRRLSHLFYSVAQRDRCAGEANCLLGASSLGRTIARGRPVTSFG